ncbi:MAG: hypothetical protein WC735_04415, partial [Candidatus Paceibacterota bacterium]
IDISEKLKDFEQKGNRWLERAQNFILDAHQAGIVASQENFLNKKNFLKKVGSNPLLRSRVVSVSYGSAWQILYDYRRFGDIKKADDLREESVSVRCTDWLTESVANPAK